MIFILTNFIFDLAYTIYLRTNKVNGMQYVGQTKDFNKREYQWNNLKQRYSNKLLQEDRMNYGFGNFETSILAEVETRDEALELEEKYISEFNTIYPNGYNFVIGGKNNSGCPKGKKQSEETIRKRVEKQSKSVNQYDLQGNFIRTWKSATEAGRTLGLNCSHIMSCCKGKRKTCGRFKWKYADEK